jgi:hypothetical protein
MYSLSHGVRHLLELDLQSNSAILPIPDHHDCPNSGFTNSDWMDPAAEQDMLNNAPVQQMLWDSTSAFDHIFDELFPSNAPFDVSLATVHTPETFDTFDEYVQHTNREHKALAQTTATGNTNAATSHHISPSSLQQQVPNSMR